MDAQPSDHTESESVSNKPHWNVWLIIILAIIVVVVVGIFIYLHRPITGTVTSVSPTGITIRPVGTSTTKTYKITSATLVGLPASSGKSRMPEQFNVNDVRIGETVVINVNPSNNQAQAITVNP